MAIGRSKPVTYNGKEYESTAELARILKLDCRKLYAKIRSNNGNVDAAVADLLTETDMIKMGEKSMAELVQYFNPEVKEKVEPVKEEPVVSQDPLRMPACNTNYKPKYIQVESVNHLIDVLANFKATTINLIDYENLREEKEILTQYATNENEINVFFYNALTCSNKFYNFTKKSKGTNIQVHTYECADQLVDHLIVFYLGALQLAYPDKKYNILSRDMGFYKFVEHLHCENINCLGINYIFDKEARYKYSLCKHIVGTKAEHRNTVAVHELDKLFEPFYERELNKADIDDLISSLDKFELIEHTTKGSFKWIKFKMPVIHEFLNKYKYD